MTLVIDSQQAGTKVKAKGKLTQRQVRAAVSKVDYDPDLFVFGKGSLLEIWEAADNEYFKGGDPLESENYGDRARECLDKLCLLFAGYQFYTAYNGSYYRVIAGEPADIGIDYCNPSHPCHY